MYIFKRLTIIICMITMLAQLTFCITEVEGVWTSITAYKIRNATVYYHNTMTITKTNCNTITIHKTNGVIMASNEINLDIISFNSNNNRCISKFVCYNYMIDGITHDYIKEKLEGQVYIWNKWNVYDNRLIWSYSEVTNSVENISNIYGFVGRHSFRRK